MTSVIKSKCCEFHVSTLNSADAYCYVCGRVHEHDHLDLRSLRMTLLGRVTKRHNLNWVEIRKDSRKYDGMKRGILCQSVITELEALCPHENPLSHDGTPLRLHMCFGADISDGQSTDSVDLSVSQGLDFTTDICGADSPAEDDQSQDDLSALVEEAATSFKIGDVLKYNPEKVQFEHI